MNTVCTCAIFLHEVDKTGHHILVHQGLANVYLGGGISGSVVFYNFQVHMHCFCFFSVQAIGQRSRTFDEFFSLSQIVRFSLALNFTDYSFALSCIRNSILHFLHCVFCRQEVMMIFRQTSEDIKQNFWQISLVKLYWAIWQKCLVILQIYAQKRWEY